jgi:hypothetical protein
VTDSGEFVALGLVVLQIGAMVFHGRRREFKGKVAHDERSSDDHAISDARTA